MRARQASIDRRGFRSGVLWTASLAILAVLVGLTPVSAAAARPIETGVTATDLAPPDGPLAFERIREAGARWTRVIIAWPAVAPDPQPATWNPTDPADPNYDWTPYDQQISWAVESGVEPLVSIFAAPEWAERCRTDPELSFSGTCNPDPEMFADFAEAAARRYSGDFGDLPKVTYWKVWNEPNLRLYFSPQFDRQGKKVSPRLYSNLLNRFSARVKQVDLDNQVVTGGLAPYEKPGGIAPMDFMRTLLCVTGRKKPKAKRSCSQRPRFDVWAHNPYTTGRPSHEALRPDDVALGDLPEMKRVLDVASRSGNIDTQKLKVPFWVTEMSWDSKGPDPGGVPMKRLTSWVSEAIYRSWKAGVSNFFWLSLRDWPSSQQSTAGPLTIESGLYFRARSLEFDKPKPILQAFRFPFVSFRTGRGIMVWGRTPESRSGRIELSFKRGGSWRPFGFVRAGANGVFTKLLRTSLGRDRIGVVRGELVLGRATKAVSAPFPLKLDKVKYQPPFGS